MQKSKIAVKIYLFLMTIFIIVISTCSESGGLGGGGGGSSDGTNPPANPPAAGFNLEEKFYEAYTKSIQDLLKLFQNNPPIAQGVNMTYTVNGPKEGTASLNLSFLIAPPIISWSQNYNWNNYTTDDGLILNGNLNQSYNTQAGGAFIGTIKCTGVADGEVQYNCQISTTGVVTGTYTIFGVTYDYATGQQIGGGGGVPGGGGPGGGNPAFNLPEKYYQAYNKCITDLVGEINNDPLIGPGLKTYTVNGTNGGSVSLTLDYSINGAIITIGYDYIWNNYTTSDNLILNGNYEYSYNSQDGGIFIGTVACSGIASGTVQYNCQLNTAGVISGTFTIDGIIYDYATGQRIN